MTARVLNPVVLSELKMLGSPMCSVRKASVPCGQQLERIKRNLFGVTNTVHITKNLHDTIEIHQKKATEKWGFDFRNGRPLNMKNSTTTHTKYVWERVPDTDFVPEMYTLSRAAHVREIPQVTVYDALLDERADQANLSTSSLSTAEEDSQDESMAAPAKCRVLRKRQPKITEYMKERKRLAQTPKKISPSKRVRTTSSSSTNSLINMFLKRH